MGIIAFIVIGFLAGLIARALTPGRQSMGFLGTTVLGMVGSLVGGIIGSLLAHQSLQAFEPAGLILSVIGAVVVLLITGYSGRRAVV